MNTSPAELARARTGRVPHSPAHTSPSPPRGNGLCALAADPLIIPAWPFGSAPLVAFLAHATTRRRAAAQLRRPHGSAIRHTATHQPTLVRCRRAAGGAPTNWVKSMVSG